jgi:selenocysteine lyase/cysteine desulfurase
MWGRPAILDTVEPQGHYFNRDIPHYNFNPAGPLHAQIGALAGLREYIEAVDGHHFDEAQPGFHARAARVFELFAEHETTQANRILEAVKAITGSRIIGQDQALTGSRAATISITIDGMSSGDAVKKLVERDIAVRNGDFYALRCLEALGIQDPEDGVVRISLVHYNTEQDVSRLVEALGELA